MKAFIFTLVVMASLQIPCKMVREVMFHEMTFCSPNRAELESQISRVTTSPKSAMVAKLTYHKSDSACAAVTFASPIL